MWMVATMCLECRNPKTSDIALDLTAGWHPTAADNLTAFCLRIVTKRWHHSGMEVSRTNTIASADRFVSRAKRARAIAVYVRLGLIVAIMVAAWQDRALWPHLHDTIQLAYDRSQTIYEDSGAVRGYVIAFLGTEG